MDTTNQGTDQMETLPKVGEVWEIIPSRRFTVEVLTVTPQRVTYRYDTDMTLSHLPTGAFQIVYKKIRDPKPKQQEPEKPEEELWL